MLIMRMEFITISTVTVRSFWHKLCPVFYVLQNFQSKLAVLVAPPTDGITKCLVRCKVYIVL